MPATLRPLSTGQLLDRTFQTYRENFVLFVGISAVPHICLLTIELIALFTTGQSSKELSTAAILTTLFVALGTLFVTVVVSAISTAATTFGVSDISLDKLTNISLCFSRVKGKIWKVVGTSMRVGLRVILGFMLLIIPGIYWLGKYGLAVPAVVLEDITSSEAIKRSSALTKDSVGRILIIYFLFWILMVAIGAGFGAVLAMFAPTLTKTAGTVTSAAVQYVLTMIVNTLVTPVMAIGLTLAYYDQRVRMEAFDIENMMNLLGESTPAATRAAGASL